MIGILKKLQKDNRGTMLMYILIFGSVATLIIIGGIASYGLSEHRVSLRKHQRDMAFHIAEAGVNYYRWHLAHAPNDWQDGTGGSGPYVHEYRDKDDNLIGYFSLEIQPPLSGTTVAMVSSTGWTVWRPEITRTVQVRVGYPALTDYTFLSNANMSFSGTANVNGITHSNGGIRFEGASDSWVRSARETYQYQPGVWRDGVWGSGGPQEFWQFPVPHIDFSTVTADLDSLENLAEGPEGHKLTNSGSQGYHIVFNGSTYDLYRVTSRDCYYGFGRWRWRRWRGWYWDGTTYCYDIRNETLLSNNNPLPVNGAIFVEDNLWIEGTVDGRVSIGVGDIPEPNPYYQIYISGNLVYNERGGDDVIGLMAQGDIIFPYEIPDVMTVEAALLSQWGTISRPYYRNDVKTSATIFGSQIYYLQGGMKWVSGSQVVSGFTDTYYIYDGNLRYYPPPAFPVGNTYDLISWEEVL